MHAPSILGVIDCSASVSTLCLDQRKLLPDTNDYRQQPLFLCLNTEVTLFLASWYCYREEIISHEWRCGYHTNTISPELRDALIPRA
jgi:hypothetical protein